MLVFCWNANGTLQLQSSTAFSKVTFANVLLMKARTSSEKAACPFSCSPQRATTQHVVITGHTGSNVASLATYSQQIGVAAGGEDEVINAQRLVLVPPANDLGLSLQHPHFGDGAGTHTREAHTRGTK